MIAAICLWTLLGFPPAAAPVVESEVTFNRDVAPIFYQRCVLCHRPRDVAPMSLLTFEESRPWAKSIERQVISRRMPPFHAEAGDYPLADDLSLSDREIATITAWVRQGSKRGNPDDLPPLPDFEKLASRHRLGPPDHVLAAQESYTLPPGSDEQRAFVLRNEFDGDVWIAAIDYDSRSPVVHHLVAVTDPTGLARELDDEDEGPGFAVSLQGGDGADRADRMMQIYMGGAHFLGGWAPGWVARKFGEDVGIRLPKGHDIVYQVHYWNGSDVALEHRPRIGLYFNQRPVRRLLRSGGPAADPHIFIKAGDPAARHEAEWVAPADLHVFSAAPHMHFLGKSMRLTAHFPQGDAKVLLDVPRFQFAWQASYVFEEPVFLPKGTRVRMVSVHDNSAANPENPNRPPRDVTFGERSDDEMAECILAYTLVEDRDLDPERGDELARLAEYLETLGQAPDNPRLQYHVGRLLVSQGRDEEAIPHLLAAVEEVPDFSPAQEELARAQERSGRLAQAAEGYRRLLELDSDNAPVRFRRGVVLEKLGRLEEAAGELAQVVALDPEAEEVLFRLAQLEEQLGRSSQALARYSTLILRGDLDPEVLGEVHFRAGNLAVQVGDSQRAMEHFRQATERAPDLMEAHLNLAILLGRSRRYEEAADRYQRVLELDPQHLPARFSHALALLLVGRDAAAARRLEEARALHPDKTELTHLLARLRAASSDPQVRDGRRALELAQKVWQESRTPDHGETLAMALAEVGRFPDAVQLQRLVVAEMENAGRPDLLPASRRRLSLYERGEPCRSPWLE